MEQFYSDLQAVKRYIQVRDQGSSRNEMIEERSFSILVDDVTGALCLDLGCGYGHYSEFLAQRGARVIGIDKAPLMIQEAKERLSSQYDISYLINDIEEVSYPDGTFDLIISNLVLHYVKDISSLLSRTHKWLKKGCCFVFTVEHPTFTANLIQDPQQWLDPQTHEGWIVSNYFASGERHGFFGLKYHRTLEEYFTALIQAGFQVLRILEPMPDASALKVRPEFHEDLERPLYMAFKCRKV